MPSGKLAPDALERVVLYATGARRSEVLIGPAVGEDASVIRWPEGKLLVFASDPIVGALRGAGRLLVRVNVNDIASKGGEPAYIAVTIILPPAMGEAAVASIMREIHEECLEAGIAIVGGHTEFNDFYERPVLSAALIGTADRVLRAEDVKRGHAIYVTKHVGIEGMAILASDRPDLLKAVFSDGEISQMQGWMEHASVLPESRLLRDYVSFMHDPTEGGFLGGLSEISRLTGLSSDTDRNAIPIHEFTLRAAKSLGFDPLRLVASGSMIAVVPDDKTSFVEALFKDSHISITRVGRMGERGNKTPHEESREELWSILRRERL
jgi:hydrogenase maturation factor